MGCIGSKEKTSFIEKMLKTYQNLNTIKLFNMSQKKSQENQGRKIKYQQEQSK